MEKIKGKKYTLGNLKIRPDSWDRVEENLRGLENLYSEVVVEHASRLIECGDFYLDFESVFDNKKRADRPILIFSISEIDASDADLGSDFQGGGVFLKIDLLDALKNTVGEFENMVFEDTNRKQVEHLEEISRLLSCIIEKTKANLPKHKAKE